MFTSSEYKNKCKPPAPPSPPEPPANIACQMLPYYSGMIPVVLASTGFNLDSIKDDVTSIPMIGSQMAEALQSSIESLNHLLESLGLPPIEGELTCDLAANIGMGSWIPDIECQDEPILGLIQPQAYSFTACQSGSICGINASFGNIAAINLCTDIAYITAHVERRRPSCASRDDQYWEDITPIDPLTGSKGITLKNHGPNAYCACGDGIIPPGALGNTYTTPGCKTVPFCPDKARINCGDLIRVTFKATAKEGTALTGILLAGFASAGVCIKPDPVIETSCGCGCPCDNEFDVPKCPTIDCGCDEAEDNPGK